MSIPVQSYKTQTHQTRYEFIHTQGAPNQFAHVCAQQYYGGLLVHTHQAKVMAE